jgi:hypothetical protein
MADAYKRIYRERQKIVEFLSLAFPRKIPPTPLYERGARRDFDGGSLKGARWPSNVNFLKSLTIDL